MSPERAQCESDLGDSQTVGAGVVQLQWEAVDAFDAALKAWHVWKVAVIDSMPEPDRLAAKCEYSAEYATRRKMRPAPPVSNVVQLTPPGYVSPFAYWGRD